MISRIDDLWLASYLLTEGAQLKSVLIFPYSNGRLTAVFELQEVPEVAMQKYASGDPCVKVHALRAAINRLRDLMYREFERCNQQTKKMPNGARRYGNENRTERDR